MRTLPSQFTTREGNCGFPRKCAPSTRRSCIGPLLFWTPFPFAPSAACSLASLASLASRRPSPLPFFSFSCPLLSSSSPLLVDVVLSSPSSPSPSFPPPQTTASLFQRAFVSSLVLTTEQNSPIHPQSYTRERIANLHHEGRSSSHRCGDCYRRRR
jgi:hypothetical protein